MRIESCISSLHRLHVSTPDSTLPSLPSLYQRMADDVVRKDQYAAEHVEAMKTPQESHHVEGNALLINKQGEIRKVPVPSNDPNDPLNFRTWEKYAVIICCCWFCKFSYTCRGLVIRYSTNSGYFSSECPVSSQWPRIFHNRPVRVVRSSRLWSEPDCTSPHSGIALHWPR